eukprot:8400601-Alexandrium_andersonii.AAC.1
MAVEYAKATEARAQTAEKRIESIEQQLQEARDHHAQMQAEHENAEKVRMQLLRKLEDEDGNRSR